MVFLNRKSLLVMCIAGSLLQGTQLHAWSFSDVTDFVDRHFGEVSGALTIAGIAFAAYKYLPLLMNRGQNNAGIHNEVNPFRGEMTPDEIQELNALIAELAVRRQTENPDQRDRQFVWLIENGQHVCVVRTLTRSPSYTWDSTYFRNNDRDALVAEVFTRYPEHGDSYPEGGGLSFQSINDGQWVPIPVNE